MYALWFWPSISPLSHTESLTLLGRQVQILVCFIHPTAPTTDTQMPGRLEKIPVVSVFAATRHLADKCTMHSSPWRGSEILPASRGWGCWLTEDMSQVDATAGITSLEEFCTLTHSENDIDMALTQRLLNYKSGRFFSVRGWLNSDFLVETSLWSPRCCEKQF